MDIQTLSDSELEVMNAIWDKGARVSVWERLEYFSDKKGVFIRRENKEYKILHAAYIS